VTVVAILGQMRSGTSLLASIVHHLGYPVAIAMCAPIPPKWESDWEDVEFTEKLLPPTTAPTREWFAGYLARRKVTSAFFGTDGRVAVKCPYLALHWKAFVGAVAAHGDDLVVLKTARSQDAIDASMRALPYLSKDDQAEIRRAQQKITPTMVVQYEDLVEEGKPLVREIAEVLDVHSDSAVSLAARLIRPKEMLTCR
jgi:hypothetical protein